MDSVSSKEVDSIHEKGKIELIVNRNMQIDSLYMTTNYSDITFVVEDQKIPAHRYILAARSEYFHSLLYGPFSEANQTEIKINVPVDAFKIILEYIYTGTLSLFKIPNIEVIIDVIKLGNVYNFLELQKPCEEYLKTIITVDNVFFILDATKILNFHELRKDCLYFIDKNVDFILANESFKNISKEVLIEILERDSFFTSEINILRAVNDWCKKTNNTIEDVIHLVRLSLIPLNELVKDVWKSIPLSTEKIYNILYEQISVQPLKLRGFLIKDENVASRKFNARTIEGDKRQELLNGDNISHDNTNGHTSHSIAETIDSAIIVELEYNCIINHIKLLLWDRDERSYSYFIDVSIDQKNWERIIDYSRFMCRSWQNLYFSSRPIKYIKIVGTHCSQNNCFCVVSLEAYYIENPPEVKNGVVIPKNNVSLYKMGACVIEGSGKNNVINGDFLNKKIYTSHSTSSCLQHIKIKLSQPYYLRSVRLLLLDENELFYTFYIETSLNDKDWEKIVDQSQVPVTSWQSFTFSLRPIVFIRIVGKTASRNEFCVVYFECPSSIDN